MGSISPKHDPQPIKSIPYDYSGRIEGGPTEDPDELTNILPSQASIINALAKKAPDRVNAPSHYTSHPSGVECIDITEHYDFCVGNAIKYLWRAGLKAEAGLTDSISDAKVVVLCNVDALNTGRVARVMTWRINAIWF